MVDLEGNVVPSDGTPDEANHAVTVGAAPKLLAVDNGNVVKHRTSQCSGWNTLLEAVDYLLDSE
jgi:hypothetical protein